LLHEVAAPVEPADAPASELAVKAVPISMKAPTVIVHPYPHPGDRLWQLSESTITFTDVE